ncbi:MAG: ISL3 family transposase [Staphylococcus simulans]|uniref:ISL3 family transposase n=3 Tax=Staphylococcus TaxID=1279 RepID=UPI002555177F|nr:ISL3 family transposase [Staphylococcus simulans]MDK7927300.1 ISL3 family transposase [Staphylococcus simulans]MDK8315867.1 ISL3 family transposase [Staphylococcus simulans]
MSNCIAKVIDYKGENIVFEEEPDVIYINLVRTLIFKGTLTYTPDCCENCGAVNQNNLIVKNGKRKTMIKLLKTQGTPSYLELKKQRFFCRGCRRSFVSKTSFVKKHYNFCNNLILHLLYQSGENRSCKSIGLDNNVSATSVIRYINKIAESVKLGPFNKLPQHIMVDEFKSVKNVVGKMSFIYCDGDTHEIIDILPDRRQKALFDYFMRFEKTVRENIKSVTMDMYSPYISLFKQLFPNAEIILDRFHLVQALNRELNKCRVKWMNHFKNTQPRLYNKLKHFWRIILKPSECLNSVEYHYQRLFKGLESEQSIVNYILDQVPELKDMYVRVNTIRALIKHNKAKLLTEEIKRCLDEPNLNIGLRRVLKSFKAFLPEIQNTLKHPARSNGPIEAMNNNIKVLKRVAYGYRNFYNFRNKILVKFKLLANKNHHIKTTLNQVA